MRTRFEREELLQSHDYVRPHEVFGRVFHGGFDQFDRYRSPRTRWRRPAITAWARQLRSRGQPVLAVPRVLLDGPQHPTVAQQAYLMHHGLTQPFFDLLTTTALVERKAGNLRSMQGPDFAALVCEPIDNLTLGHLNHGLLAAHGLDEGGDPAFPEVGGHDQMWLTARDFMLGIDRHDGAAVEKTEVSVGMFEREYPDIPQEIELSLRFFMNVLLSEIRAEPVFEYCTQLLGRSDVLSGRPEQRMAARALIERIRSDELSHVGYLRVAISELSAMRWHSQDGGTLAGDEIIGPLWRSMVDRHRALEISAAENRRTSLDALVVDASRRSPAVDIAAYRALG